ncbi:hypothetical protein CPB86DRAFT_778231 [Serendipita vermifera]|nr:hypothetical protein CPB86DRAFT_778231 [Serendipita vermifera]
MIDTTLKFRNVRGRLLAYLETSIQPFVWPVSVYFVLPKDMGIIAPKVLSLIPRVTGMLADVDREVRSATAKALIPLAQDATWQPTIEEAFSHYRFLLEERDMSALRDALNGPEGQGS